MSLEELRQQRAKQLQQQLADQQAEAEAQKQYEQQKDVVLKQIMTPEAKSRLTTLKLANPSLAEQVEKLIIYLAQSGQIKKIDDTTFKTILTKIKGKKRDTKITRK